MWCCLLGVAVVNEVPLNDRSALRSDISSIAHDIDERLLTIKLSRSRRCQNPLFMVRLSGPSLHLLQLQNHEYSPPDKHGTVDNVKNFLAGRENVFYYTYPPIFVPGNYFLEVVLLLCSELDGQNFKSICVEGEGTRVVTGPYSVFLNGSSDVAPYPQWQLPQPLQTNATVLPTRYQGHSLCPDDAAMLDCIAQENTLSAWQHRLYDWSNKPDWIAPLDRKHSHSQLKICFVGASHARGISRHGQTLNPSGERMAFYYIESKFPSTFRMALTRITQIGCDYAVVGYGQWPLSAAPDPVCNAACYQNDMQGVMEATKSYVGPTRFFFRSMNYNGLGKLYTACPPFDYRLPPLVDMYNTILRQVTKQYGQRFIDTTHIVGPVWDGAEDFCHPTGKAFKAEAEWILYELFSSADYVRREGLQNEEGPTSAQKPSTDVAVPFSTGQEPLIRFTDAATVYRREGNVLRPFLDRRTFLEMGYEFGAETVLDAAQRGKFTFGPTLALPTQAAAGKPRAPRRGVDYRLVDRGLPRGVGIGRPH
jgi:hypothetical protein